MSSEKLFGWTKDETFKFWDTSHRKPCSDITNNLSFLKNHFRAGFAKNIQSYKIVKIKLLKVPQSGIKTQKRSRYQALVIESHF